MPSSLPILRQTAWLSIVPQGVLFLLLFAATMAWDADNPFLVGAACYLFFFLGLRVAVPRHHRRGIGLFRQERFADAIPEFRKSYEFFSKHRWLDRYRALTMLSSSRISYREMALLNVAFCLSQIGEHEQALAEYRRVLSEFPGSKLAEAAI